MRSAAAAWRRRSVAVLGTTAALLGAPWACDATSAPDGGEVGDRSATSSDAMPSSAADAAVIADAADADDGAPRLAPDYVHFDVNHVLGTGQSLSVGAYGAPALTLTQPYNNLMFVGGPVSEATGLTAFVPLVEGDVVGEEPPVETMSSSFANLVTRMARQELMPTAAVGGPRSHDLLVSVHGLGGAPYTGVKRGSVAYTNGLAQVVAARDLAASLGRSYVVRAVTTVHGESDHINANPAYAENVLAWQSDYETDVKALTGQTLAIPMFESQFSSWTKFGTTTSPIPAAQLAAHVASKGKVVLVGAKYHLPHPVDGIHLSNAGYRRLGEDYAKVYRRVVLEGKTWEPVRPKSIVRNGVDVLVAFHVPSPPLVLDEVLVTNPGSFGFEVTDASDGPPLAISSVRLVADDTVAVTLTRPPTAPARLRYAYSAELHSWAGPKTGARGNLRDSDPTVSSSTGERLYNWCVHFDEAMP